MSADFRLFWGKYQAPDDAMTAHGGADRVTWHPLAWHSLDVAAVAGELVPAESVWAGRLAHLLGMPRSHIAPFLRFMALLHDIGKFSRAFQSKVPARWPGEVLGPMPPGSVPGVAHDQAGNSICQYHMAAFWQTWLSPRQLRHFAPLIRAATGHHGRPPVQEQGDELTLGREGISAAIDFLDTAWPVICPELPEILSALAQLRGRAEVKHASLLVAGLVTTADWLGSDTQYFPYVSPDMSLPDYWQGHARPGAGNAVSAAGVLSTQAAPPLEYADLAGISQPTPMQDWAMTVPLADDPALYVIEDATGAGKTEAALMLAHRLMAAGQGDGLYFALPTMATANGIYARLAESYRRLFSSSGAPSLALAHGGRDLSDAFRRSVLPPGLMRQTADVSDDAGAAVFTQCADWIADDRRLAFLADIGVGTIDQALLAILPVRHQSLRLAGLARRVLILDEIHAYDPYMREEIQQFLTFQQALGGPVILLSATLPSEMFDGFQRAWQAGGADASAAPAPAPEPTATPYPAASVITGADVQQSAVPAAPASLRRVDVRFLPDTETALQQVAAASRAGQAVLYLRNTVDDAVAACQALAGQVQQVDLFHARFAMADRLEIEGRVLRRFGRDGTQADRAGQVLVATQVVEQSLDLDFDVLVTDLAPVDLLIQRAGRLWRHARAGRTGTPVLQIVSPDPVDQADEDWIMRLLPGTGHVYDNHGLLWLTARVLQDAGEIVTPAGMRPLIEQVYGPDAIDAVPPDLQENWFAAEGEAFGDADVARLNTMRLSVGYDRDGGLWQPEERTPTRLGPETRTFRLARLVDGAIRPWASRDAGNEQLPDWRLWRMSELTLRCSQADDAPLPETLADVANEIRSQWGRYRADMPMLLLTGAAGDVWQGTVARNGAPRPVHYCRQQGFRFQPDA